MTEKSQKTAVAKNTRNKKPRKKSRSQSRNKNLGEKTLNTTYEKTLKCKKSLERLRGKETLTIQGPRSRGG